jgi:ABC-type transport system involved in multi-copper enzyme maturation permease subunit
LSQSTAIAANELSRLVRQPVIIVIAFVLFALIAINGITNATTLQGYGKDDRFLWGISSIFYFTSIYLTILSMFIGVMSIAEDRSSGSLRILLTKPLYRRDVLAGKLIGMMALLMLIAVCCVLFGAATIMIFSGGPTSTADVILRISTYIILLFLNCALTLTITMAIGVIVKNVSGTLICVGTLFFFDWLVNIPQPILKMIGNLLYLNQRILYFNTTAPDAYLFDISSSYSEWFNHAWPFIIAMVIALMLFMSLTFFIFCRDDD